MTPDRYLYIYIYIYICIYIYLATESPLKVMKNAFYFTLKPLLVLKIFKLLS